MTEDKKVLLQRAAEQKDIVCLKLCISLYEICNDNLFDNLTPLEFCNFLNLKHPKQVKAAPKQKIRVCYMVDCVKRAISPKKNGELWAEAFLEQCDIKQSYYNSHYRDVCGEFATEDNQDFRKDMDSAIERGTVKQSTT